MSTCGRVIDEKCNVRSSMDSTKSDNNMSRTDLDSHANMVLVGKNRIVLNETGRHAEVAPFAPDYESLHKVSISDAVVEYDDKHSEEICFLVVYGALLVPSIDHSLVTPFTLSKTGLEVDTMPN